MEHSSDNSERVSADTRFLLLHGWKDIETGVCTEHGQYIRSAEWNGETIHFACPYCTALRQAQREADARLEKRVGSACIPKRFVEKTVDGYAAQTEAQRRVKAVCEDWLQNAAQSIALGRCLVFAGAPGTGKTHLACGIANAVIRSGYSARFSSAAGIVRAVRSTWSASGGSEADVIRDFTSPDLLVVDEVGTHVGTQSELQTLFAVLNARYEGMKPTFLISNLSPANLQKFVGDRAFDRFKENDGRVLVFNWESYR